MIEGEPFDSQHVRKRRVTRVPRLPKVAGAGTAGASA